MNSLTIKKYISNQAITLTSYSVMHGLVDAICAFTVFKWIDKSGISVGTIFVLIISYNILAFGTQPLLGYMTDKIGRPNMLAAVAVASVITGCVLGTLSPLISICLLGLGNSLFHVAGGSICLNLKYDRTFAAGVFVGPGNLGLVTGTLLGKSLISLEMSITIFILSCVVLFFISKVFKKSYDPSNKETKQLLHIINNNIFGIILGLIIVCIIIRAFIGGAIEFPWKFGTTILLITSLVVTTGKIAGGIFSLFLDKRIVAVTGLLISAPLLAFTPSNIYAGLIGMFLFNLTMPITLSITADLFPKNTGFAFGLTAGALLIGVFPFFFKALLPMIPQWFIFMTIILSAIVLYTAIRILYKYNHEYESDLTNILMKDGYSDEKSENI